MLALFFSKTKCKPVGEKKHRVMFSDLSEGRMKKGPNIQYKTVSDSSLCNLNSA